MEIAIASGKGGTGKTTLAVNLASLLSCGIFDSINTKIVLVDLDVEEPNSGLFLNGKLVLEEDKFRAIPQWDPEQCNLCGKCKTLCHFNAIAELPKTILVFPELCHSCYACSELCPEQALPMTPIKMGVLKHFEINNKLSFVESRLDIGEVSAVPLIKQTKEYINAVFSKEMIKIFDSPPGLSCPVIESVNEMDLVVLVTEPTPFGLYDLKLAVETMLKLNLKFTVVINRYGIGYKDVEDYCLNSNISIIGKIPYKKEAAKLYSQGKLLFNNIPEIKDELKKIIREIFSIITKNERDSNNIG